MAVIFQNLRTAAATFSLSPCCIISMARVGASSDAEGYGTSVPPVAVVPSHGDMQIDGFLLYLQIGEAVPFRRCRFY